VTDTRLGQERLDLGKLRLGLDGVIPVELTAAAVGVHDDESRVPELRLLGRASQRRLALRLGHVSHHDGPHRPSSL
jgi:hypothetical protein